MKRLGVSEETLFPDLPYLAEKNRACEPLPETLLDREKQISDTSDMLALKKAGERAFHRKQFQAALAYLGDYANHAPDAAEPHWLKGNALAGLKRWADAIGCYTKAIELKDAPFPGDNVSFPDWVISYHLATYHYNRGNVRAALGQYAEAIEDYTATLELADEVRPQSPGDHHFEVTLGRHARFNRATTHYMNQDFDRALDDFRQYQEDEGARGDICLGMGNAQLMQGRFGDAREHYGEGADLEPGRQTQACRDNLAAVGSLIETTGPVADGNGLSVEYPHLVVQTEIRGNERAFPFAGNRGNYGNWGWGDGYQGLSGFAVRLRPA